MDTSLFLRAWLYGMVLPGILGVAVLASIVLPRGGAELTFTRLFTGLGAMIAVQVVGGVLGGRFAARH